MEVSRKIATIICITIIIGMLAVPVMADTTINGSLFTSNGYGPGDGSGTGDNAKDGDGYGPATGDCTSAALFSSENTLLLARGGNGNGGGNGGNGGGSGGGRGDCDGSGSGDRDGDKAQDKNRDRNRSCMSC